MTCRRSALTMLSSCLATSSSRQEWFLQIKMPPPPRFFSETLRVAHRLYCIHSNGRAGCEIMFSSGRHLLINSAKATTSAAASWTAYVTESISATSFCWAYDSIPGRPSLKAGSESAKPEMQARRRPTTPHRTNWLRRTRQSTVCSCVPRASDMTSQRFPATTQTSQQLPLSVHFLWLPSFTQAPSTGSVYSIYQK